MSGGNLKIIGVIGVLSGLLGLSALPLLSATADNFAQFNSNVRYARWGYVLGSCALVWGVETTRTADWRSLTPSIAFVAPVLSMLSRTASHYVPVPRSDPPPWQPPETVVHALLETFSLVGGVVLAPLLLGIGVAVARGQRRWVFRGFTYLFAISVLVVPILRRDDPLSGLRILMGIGAMWGTAVVYGIPPFIIGYVTASPTNDT